MLDIGIFNERRLAKALLREDHDLLSEKILDNDWISGEIEEVQTEARDAAKWELTVSYRDVSNDEGAAFPSGDMIASDDLTPGENQAYRVTFVCLFEDLIEGYHVILAADHGGAGESDESHEAYTTGIITVVPAADAPEHLRIALARQRRDVMHDARYEIDKIARKLTGATHQEMREFGVTDAFGELARQLARAA